MQIKEELHVSCLPCVCACVSACACIRLAVVRFDYDSIQLLSVQQD